MNGGSDLRTHLATTRGGRTLLEVDAWIPSEVKAISPLVERLMRSSKNRIASRATKTRSNWRSGKLCTTQSFTATGWMLAN